MVLYKYAATTYSAHNGPYVTQDGSCKERLLRGGVVGLKDATLQETCVYGRVKPSYQRTLLFFRVGRRYVKRSNGGLLAYLTGMSAAHVQIC